MTKKSLTENEKNFLLHLFDLGYALTDDIEPHFVGEDIAQDFGFGAAGTLSSLLRKGVIQTDGEPSPAYTMTEMGAAIVAELEGGRS